MSDPYQRSLQTGMPIVRTAVALGGCAVYSSVDVTVLSGSNTAVPFDSERFDDGETPYHSTSSNTTRLTVPISGRYLFGGHFKFNSDSTGYRRLGLRLNGSTYLAFQTAGAVGEEQGMSIVRLFELTTADYIELVVYQNSGVGMTIAPGASFGPEFWVYRIA